jgi:hypothetical protein
VAQTPAIIPRGDRMGLMAAGNAPGISAISLPTAGINDGHELTLVNITPPVRGWSFALERRRGRRRAGAAAGGGGGRKPAPALQRGSGGVGGGFGASLGP